MTWLICWWRGHDVKDKGWNIVSCRRCGKRRSPNGRWWSL